MSADFKYRWLVLLKLQDAVVHAKITCVCSAIKTKSKFVGPKFVVCKIQFMQVVTFVNFLYSVEIKESICCIQGIMYVCGHLGVFYSKSPYLHGCKLQGSTDKLVLFFYFMSAVQALWFLWSFVMHQVYMVYTVYHNTLQYSIL